ncbi:MaoC family dehydratase [Lachnospiraceae bacterium JLR.KK008]
MQSLSMKQLSVGQKAEREFPVTQESVAAFAEVSQDSNPLHLDETYASKTRFGRRIAHGMLTGSFISAMIGTELPGEGCIYMKQELTFLRPVYAGDVVRVEIVVSQLQTEKKRAVLSTNCYNQNGEQVIAGTALVKPKEE